MLNTKYYGMPSPATMPGSENEFPQFADGDVLIVISTTRRYKLHSATLRRSSPTFVALLDEEAAADLSKAVQKKGVTTRYRLHLVKNENAGDRTAAGVEPPAHVFRRIPLDERGAPLGEFPDLLGDANENGRVVQQFVLVSFGGLFCSEFRY